MSDSDDGLDILGRLVTEGRETRDLKNRRDELRAKRQRTIRQYEIRTGEILLETSPEPKPGHVTFAPDDKLVARIPFHAFPAEVPEIPPVSPAPATPLDALRFLLSPTRRSPARPENVDNRAFQLPPQDDDDDDAFTTRSRDAAYTPVEPFASPSRRQIASNTPCLHPQDGGPSLRFYGDASHGPDVAGSAFSARRGHRTEPRTMDMQHMQHTNHK